MNDLYKCFLISLINGNCPGGVLILPANFWFSTETSTVRLRSEFLMKYAVPKLNVFEEEVFNEVNITTCSFQFEQRRNANLESKTVVTFYPDESIQIIDNLTQIQPTLYLKIFERRSGIVKVQRFNDESNLFRTNIVINCIDNKYSKISAKLVKTFDLPESLKSSRGSFIVHISERLSIEDQNTLVELFNETLMGLRRQYGCLIFPYFLGFGRKRLSFVSAYTLISNLVESHLLQHPVL